MRRISTWLGRLTTAALLGTLLASPIWSAEESDPLRLNAIKLNNITGESVIEAKIRALIADKEGTKKLLAVAREMAEEKKQPFNYNAALILARSAQFLKDNKSAEVFFLICRDDAMKLQSASKLMAVYDGLIDLYYDGKNYAEAIKRCQEFIEIESEDENIQRAKLLVMERMIQAKAKQGKHEEAIRDATRLAERDANGWYFLNLKAWVLREANKLEDAVQTYKEVIERIGKARQIEKEQRERMINRVHYILSSLYVDLKKVDLAVEELEELVKRDPENPTYYNDLGFILADNDLKLDEAEKLIRKALELDAARRKKLREAGELTAEEDLDNPAYLDSLGWVLYKKKQYGEAKKHLLAAIAQKDGEHIEILDHLADTHLALGEKNEAIAIWKKALTLEPFDRRDEKRKKRISEKLGQHSK